MLLQGFKQSVGGVKCLHPHLAAGALCGITPSAATGLHQQRKQTLRRSEVARKQGAIGVHRSHQSDAPEIMALGNHLRAHQHIYLAAVHVRQLGLQSPFQFGAVGINSHDANGLPIGPFHVCQQLR